MEFKQKTIEEEIVDRALEAPETWDAVKLYLKSKQTNADAQLLKLRIDEIRDSKCVEVSQRLPEDAMDARQDRDEDPWEAA